MSGVSRQSKLRQAILDSQSKARDTRSRNRQKHRSTSNANPAESDSVTAKWATYASLQAINASLGFSPLSEEDATRLEQEATQQSGDVMLDRKVCAVTDTWVFTSAAVHFSIEASPIDATEVVLIKDWCAKPVVEYYDCSDLDQRLKGLLLSRRGFDRGPGGVLFAWMTATIHKDLQATATALRSGVNVAQLNKPPRFADGFVAGAFPEIDETTVIEKQTIGLAQVRGVVKIVYGGPGNVLQSHLLCWDNREAVIANQIPSVVSKERFQLVLAGPMTPAQEVIVSRRHQCCGDRVARAYQLLRTVNPLYADIDGNDAFFTELNSADDISMRLDSADTNIRIAEARARQAIVVRMHDVVGGVEHEDGTLVKSETVLLNTTSDCTEQDRLRRAYETVTGQIGCFVAQRSPVLLTRNL